MESNSSPLISYMIAAPFLGIALLALVRSTLWLRCIALGSALATLVIFLFVFFNFDSTKAGMQFIHVVPWIPTFNIRYAVGVDGISILLVLLTTLLTPLCVLCSWTSITAHVRAFMMLILLVEGAMLVVFTAMDLFLFFIMWEVTMIPMYFMIVLRGGPKRVSAGLQIVLYSLTGRFCRGGKKGTDVYIESQIGERCGDHLLASVVAVLADLGYEDPGSASGFGSKRFDAFAYAMHLVAVSNLVCKHPGDGSYLRHVSPENLFERVADLADRSLCPGSVDGCGQEIPVSVGCNSESCEGFTARCFITLCA